MIDIKCLSPEVHIQFNGLNNDVIIKKNGIKTREVDIRNKRVSGICLKYSSMAEQDRGIKDIIEAFESYKHGVVGKVPVGLKVEEAFGVVALEYGMTAKISQTIADIAKEEGIIAYWDEETIFICVSQRYRHIPYSLIELIKPGKARFAFHKGPVGNDLVIIENK